MTPGQPLVSVITPTIPGREDFLDECIASVEGQLGAFEYEHLYELDDTGAGNSATVNRLVHLARGKWLLPLADDDLLLPAGLRSLLNEASRSRADIVYSPPLVNGNEDRWWFFQAPPVLPATALIRAELWRELGGYDENLEHEEDRALWIKALEAGAVFSRVDYPVWVYRQHDHNKSFNKVAA